MLTKDIPKVLNLNKRSLHYFILMLITYGLYHQTFYSDWSIDDFKVIVNNADIKSLADFIKNTNPGRPLRELSFWIDYKIFGLTPYGFHFQHLFWHGLNGIIVYCISRKLFFRALPSLIAAILFLVHPITVEVIANISHRKDSLSLAFSMLSLLVFGWAHDSQTNRKKTLLFLASLVLYLVACKAKLNAALTPLLWLAYEYRFVQPVNRVLAKFSARKSLLIVFGAGCIAYVWKILSIGGLQELQNHAWKMICRMEMYPKPDLGDYLHLLLKSWGTMISKIILPINLAPEYSISSPGSWLDIYVVTAFLSVSLALITLFYASKKPSNNAFFSLLWILVFWLPISNLWPSASLAADRYWYAILPGIVLLLIHSTIPFWDKYRTLTLTVFTGIIVILSSMSFQQSKYWKNNALLWQHAIKVNPGSSAANHNMGVTYYLNGDAELGIEYLRKSIEIYPYKTIAYYNLWQIYTELGMHDEAQKAKEKMNQRPRWPWQTQ